MQVHKQKMFKSLLIILSFFCFIITFAHAMDVDFELTPNLSDHSYIAVKVSFQGEKSGETTIEFPYEWANVRHGECLKNINISSQGKLLTLIETDDPAHKKVCHNSSAQLILNYEVHPLSNQDTNPNVHSAIIKKELIHAPGYALFAFPQSTTDRDKFRFTIHWEN